MTQRAPQRQRKDDRLIHPKATPDEIKSDFALGPLDTATRAMDLKWGVDRLPELVSAEMNQKYAFSVGRLNEAYDASNPTDTAAWAAVCIRGLAAMDAEAAAAGCPQASSDVWQLQACGLTYGLIRDTAHWPAAKAAHPGLTILTMQEVAHLLQGYQDSLPTVDAIKTAFPGATISAVRQPTALEVALDDEIPF
jgi:hypothetical protein